MAYTTYFLNEEDYFLYFEQKCNDKLFYNKYPLIVAEIKAICDQMKKKIELVNSQNFFIIHSELMGLDARLQIIIALLPSDNDDILSSLTEEEVVEFSRKDYRKFLRESFDVEDNIIPHSLYFSII